MLSCDKCRNAIPSGANFCPHCGDPVTEADKPRLPKATNAVPFADIIFGYSSSANYERAVSICKRIPTYKTKGDGKQAKHGVRLKLTELELIKTIFDLVGSWKSSTMKINGKRATKKDLTQGALGCFAKRQEAYDKDSHCFDDKYGINVWGCKRLGISVSDLGKEWLDFGRMRPDGVWEIDKQFVKGILIENLRENEFCPALNKKKVIEAFNAMPDTIDPRKDDRWEYRERYKNLPNGTFKTIAVGVQLKQEESEGYVLEEKVGLRVNIFDILGR